MIFRGCLIMQLNKDDVINDGVDYYSVFCIIGAWSYGCVPTYILIINFKVNIMILA